MNQVTQTCTYKGHAQNKVKYACIDSNCELNRMICSQCLLQNIHKHGNENNSHILDHQGIEQLIHQKLNRLKEQKNKEQVFSDQFAQMTIMYINKIQEQLQIIVKMLKQLQDCSFYTNKINSLDEKISSIKNQKLIQIDNQFMKSLKSDDQEQFKLPKIQLIINEWDNIIKTIQSSKQLSELWNQQKQSQILNIKDAEYNIKLVDESEEDIVAATQSNDLKYIVSGGEDCILKIWDYSNLKLIIQKELDNSISIVKFTDDSKLLYVGIFDGVLYCFDVSSNFKQAYKQQIHNCRILNLYCVTNTIILTASSLDKTIIKTEISLNQQIFVINAHNGSICGLDFHKFKNIIVSCSGDRSIKLWDNSNGSLIMQKEEAHNNSIYEVFFVFENDQLLSLDSNNVFQIWQIRYDNKEMILIKSITDSNKIYNISLVNNQQFIMLICDEYIKFYTIQGECIRTIKHDIKQSCITFVNYQGILIQINQSLDILQLYQEKNNWPYVGLINDWLKLLKYYKLQRYFLKVCLICMSWFFLILSILNLALLALDKRELEIEFHLTITILFPFRLQFYLKQNESKNYQFWLQQNINYAKRDLSALTFKNFSKVFELLCPYDVIKTIKSKKTFDQYILLFLFIKNFIYFEFQQLEKKPLVEDNEDNQRQKNQSVLI